MRIRSLVLVLSSFVAVAACRDRDQALEKRVEARLAAEPEGSGVTVAVDNRVVRLIGVVDSDAEKTRMENAVAHVDGVLAVQNELVVLRSVTATSATVDAHRALAASVEAQLAAAGFDDLHVTVRDGTVRVAGAVPSAKHDEALEIARRAAPEFRIDDETIVK